MNDKQKYFIHFKCYEKPIILLFFFIENNQYRNNLRALAGLQNMYKMTIALS